MIGRSPWGGGLVPSMQPQQRQPLQASPQLVSQALAPQQPPGPGFAGISQQQLQLPGFGGQLLSLVDMFQALRGEGIKSSALGRPGGTGGLWG